MRIINGGWYAINSRSSLLGWIVAEAPATEGVRVLYQGMLHGRILHKPSSFFRQLEDSEQYVAGLLHNVTLESSNIDPTRCLEITITDFHRGAGCRITLFVNTTEIILAPNSSPILTHLVRYAASGLIKESSRRWSGNLWSEDIPGS